MNYLSWVTAMGCLMLFMSLIFGWLNRTPVPVFGIYLLVGIACGPWVFGILNLDIHRHSISINRITDIAMAVSLFITGLKMRHSLKSPFWKTGIRLAIPSMLITIALVMIAAHFFMGLSWPLSLILAAIIAPTDPVLASLISVNDARDNNELRLSLSCEAGLNDGTALPFLMLGMLWQKHGSTITTSDLWEWFGKDLIWALPGGLIIGYILGRSIGLLATHFRHTQRVVAPSDFIALGLICLSFSLAMTVHASGFLAAFAAGIGLRSAEIRVQRRQPLKEKSEEDTPAEMQINPHTRHAIEHKSSVKSVGLVIGDALSFGDTVERLMAAALIIMLGVTLAYHWNMPAMLLALLLFLLIRPLAVYFSTACTGIPAQERLMMGWLGIRGIGSLNYIAYAYSHGLQGGAIELMTNIAITIVTLSVLIHGISVSPLMNLRKSKRH